MRHGNNQTYIFGGREEGGTGDICGKVTQESTSDSDTAKVTEKKRRKNRQIQTKKS